MKKKASKSGSAAKAKIRKVMREFEQGELNIGKSDKKVKDRKQAVAIALRQAAELVKRKRSR
jgi:hypothetical protein